MDQHASLEEYKNLHYKDNRGMKEYFDLLPELKGSLHRDVSLLDIGCGEGLALKQIHDKFCCKVIGTNVTPQKKTGIQSMQCRADNLPFKCDVFDIIISVHGISWEPNQKKALEEIVRILKPGGKAFIYLLQFSYSIDLFIGEKFWKDLDRKAYVNKFEFSPLTEIKGADISSCCYCFPENMVNGCCSEWYVKICKY